MSVLLNLANQPPFEVSVKSFYTCRNQALVQIKATDDPTADHVPSTIVLVIDVSGSMGSMAATADDSDGASGLSQLDIVKHASRTTIDSLHEQDQLAVVSFSTNAKVEFGLANMTKENRAAAWKAVDALMPTASTNLYGGLIKALDLIQCQETMPSNPNIMLLTDGMPNVSPPRGEVETLQKHLDTHPELQKVRIATFGFGYSLKSDLLADIANLGRSLIAFIPDSSFVGTVFVNAVANFLASACTAPATLKLEACPGIELVSCPTGQKHTKTSWGLQIELPSLLYGQTLDVLVETRGDPSVEPFEAFLELEGVPKPLTSSPSCIDSMDPEDAYFCRANVRSTLIGFIRSVGRCESLVSLQKAKDALEDCKQKALDLSNDVSAEATSSVVKDIGEILLDLDGQVSEAYSRLDWHQRWGIHYILSLAAAHTLQQCSNFKDPGLQTYATQKFSLLRDASEAKFISLPPPKPSRKVRTEVRSMRAFYNAAAGCFGSGAVLMTDGCRKDISMVRAGDLLCSSQGPVRVRCVVETPSATGVEGLVTLKNGVTVTPWHPVRVSSEQEAWSFPYQLVFPEWKECRRVFNLVLEDGASSFQIGGYDAVSLGHGLKGDPVAEHAYFGCADRVIRDLRRMEGWESGHVTLPPNPLRRDAKTGVVIGYASNQEEAQMDISGDIAGGRAAISCAE